MWVFIPGFFIPIIISYIINWIHLKNLFHSHPECALNGWQLMDGLVNKTTSLKTIMTRSWWTRIYFEFWIHERKKRNGMKKLVINEFVAHWLSPQRRCQCSFFIDLLMESAWHSSLVGFFLLLFLLSSILTTSQCLRCLGLTVYGLRYGGIEDIWMIFILKTNISEHIWSACKFELWNASFLWASLLLFAKPAPVRRFKNFSCCWLAIYLLFFFLLSFFFLFVLCVILLFIPNKWMHWKISKHLQWINGQSNTLGNISRS